VRELTDLIAQVHAKGALAVVAADLMSLLLLKSPGEMGADVALGNTQRFGVPMGFGGPHAAYFATRDEHKRSMPGRIIGVSIDARGNQALRMAMQTREQHIRREKATSNICTSQALLALMAGFYAIYHGPDRLRTIATRIHRLATILARGLEAGGFSLSHAQFFDTLAVQAGNQQAAIMQRALDAGINLRALDGGRIGLSLDERSTRAEVEALWRIFCESGAPAFDAIEAASALSLPAVLLRQDAYLAHPIFNSYHSETEMLRYLRKLESRDIALNRAMIPLGSCTMKLNATTEMIPITWPAFANLHPFAPQDQAAGYAELMQELGDALIECTGYDVLSFQPNSGAQGEYAGLLAIRHYHRSRCEAHRDICLIPSSAHGTNPASAAMAGMRVVIVECDAQGNVDIDDLRLKAERHGEELAALMVTYPSTHGVFEQNIVEICALVHEHGGQVYLDGANMNALVGIARPGKFGADVSHLNLHKTFCIPHGGGGPGMGPIGVRAHLAPFLPGHVCTPIAGVHDDSMSVSAAPFGSASILPISWVYATLMGAAGLRKATQVAILSANYIATRLAHCYQVLYTGANGRVAHECIIDLRPIKERSGISEEDIAKRLVDYGFHAPTMSFPVPGTLMVEPTESEPKRELDRFCDAMISIHREVMAVENGQARRDRQRAEERPAHAARHHRRRVAAPLLAQRRGLPRRKPARRQVLGAGQPHRQRLRRSQPVLLVPRGGKLPRTGLSGGNAKETVNVRLRPDPGYPLRRWRHPRAVLRCRRARPRGRHRAQATRLRGDRGGPLRQRPRHAGCRPQPRHRHAGSGGAASRHPRGKAPPGGAGDRGHCHRLPGAARGRGPARGAHGACRAPDHAP
jgi:glycine dehydrogenase